MIVIKTFYKDKYFFLTKKHSPKTIVHFYHILRFNNLSLNIHFLQINLLNPFCLMQCQL